MTAAVTLDMYRVRRAIDDQIGRFVALLRSVSEPDKNAIGRWTIGETAAHVVHSLQTNAGVVRGEGSPLSRLDRLAAFNDLGLQELPERDPKILAADLEKAGIQAEEAAAERAWDEPVEWHGGLRLPAAAVAALAVGECILHGFDIARAAERPWPIPKDHASLVFDAYTFFLPHYLDAGKASGVNLCYDVRIRRGSRVFIVIEDGALRVEAPSRRRVDCHISADPVAFLLVGYNRIPQLRPILAGKLVAWGRKPWAGPRMTSFLASP